MNDFIRKGWAIMTRALHRLTTSVNWGACEHAWTAWTYRWDGEGGRWEERYCTRCKTTQQRDSGGTHSYPAKHKE